MVTAARFALGFVALLSWSCTDAWREAGGRVPDATPVGKAAGSTGPAEATRAPATAASTSGGSNTGFGANVAPVQVALPVGARYPLASQLDAQKPVAVSSDDPSIVRYDEERGEMVAVAAGVTTLRVKMPGGETRLFLAEATPAAASPVPGNIGLK